MGTFSSSRHYRAPAAIIPAVVKDLTGILQAEGYDVDYTELVSGGMDVSITKGDFFKSVIGMKSALKVNISPSSSGFIAEAGIGIFGQQVIPTLVSMLFFWPVLITQIWGIVRQSKLDDHVLDLIQKSVNRNSPVYSAASAGMGLGMQFCTHCGNSMPTGSRFCSGCGERV
jgi:hypothetical protein